VRLLVVEDETRVRSFLQRGFAEAGMAVDTATDGEQAVDAALVTAYDAIVLDLMLPGRGGLDVLRELRARGRASPVLVLTARDAVEDRVRGLDAGADDRPLELTAKEFSLLEYLARHAGEVVTRTMIAEHVWNIDFDNFSNVIDVYIRYLRRKVDDPFEEKLIQTRRGVGYVLCASS
jgi:two-component system copper resistance phosphate regulon response regulator CusR